MDVFRGSYIIVFRGSFNFFHFFLVFLCFFIFIIIFNLGFEYIFLNVFLSLLKKKIVKIFSFLFICFLMYI
jgi:hypothetical protein